MRARQSKGTQLAHNIDPAMLARFLSFNLLMGSAAADATDAQRARLQEIPDLLREGAELRKLSALVFDIMGSDWAPGAEWMAHIEALKRG